MALALTLLAAAVAAGRFQGTLVLILILGYLAFFAACIGPVFWTLVSEIFPNNIRGTAMAVPVLTQWIANAMVVLLFPYAFNQIGKAVTFGFLAAMAVAQAVVTWLWVPETKNKTLEEIEKAWANRERVATQYTQLRASSANASSSAKSASKKWSEGLRTNTAAGARLFERARALHGASPRACSLSGNETGRIRRSSRRG